MSVADLKQRVKEHWEQEVCGSRYGLDHAADRKKYFNEIDRVRYEQEPMLPGFARFEEGKGRRVLEVGLGTGADFSRWARSGAFAFGRDLTEASVRLVRERLELAGLQADVAQGDAESLEFPDNFFDIFYSWGVLMASPDTEKTIAEAYRVLKPGGAFRIMLYHYPCMTAYMTWVLYGPVRGNFTGPRKTFLDNVESPGQKTYTVEEARQMVGKHFRTHPIEIRTYLGAGDLLEQKLSKRYPGKKWKIVQKLYPRWFVRHVLGNRFGTEMTIETIK